MVAQALRILRQSRGVALPPTTPVIPARCAISLPQARPSRRDGALSRTLNWNRFRTAATARRATTSPHGGNRPGRIQRRASRAATNRRTPGGVRHASRHIRHPLRNGLVPNPGATRPLAVPASRN